MESSRVDNIITDFIYEAGGVKIMPFMSSLSRVCIVVNHNMESLIRLLSHNSSHTAQCLHQQFSFGVAKFPQTSPDQFSHIKFAFLSQRNETLLAEKIDFKLNYGCHRTRCFGTLIYKVCRFIPFSGHDREIGHFFPNAIIFTIMNFHSRERRRKK